MKKKLLIISALLIVILFFVGAYLWYTYVVVKTIKYDPQLTIYWGGMNGNSIVLVSEDGSKALVVDTKAEDDAKDLRESITAKDIIIVNTHSHYDHTLGNSLYPKATVIAGAYSKEQWSSDSDESRYPDQTIEPKAEKVIRIGSETVHVYNTGRGHTRNDVVVYCEKRQLLVTGDLIFHEIHPVLYSKSGSHVGSWIKILEILSDKYSIKTVIPGHGRISDKSIITGMRDYFVRIRNAVNDKEKLANLKKEYAHYFSIPNMTGFDNTVNFIKNEQELK
ncbi:MAG: MBL fold metallo-hydrolase [Desulfobacterales bacterium]|nr:MBL fold metallo-hydrolase [Desulfobacterales bacterium]